jgi:hypothetical protein
MSSKPSPIRISKLDAARRQLKTAITLWFEDGDPVSLHTLAYAAYEIIHTISKKRDPYRRDLLFDTLMIKEEHRSKFNIGLKKHANFFKHGDRDGDASIEFSPLLSELFIFYAILGSEVCGTEKSEHELAFVWWLHFHRPETLTDKGRQTIREHFTINEIEHMRSRPKREFLCAFVEAPRVARRRSAPPHRNVARIPFEDGL